MRKPLILLRNGWQSVNIGDMAHGPGCLSALTRRLPDADFAYWPVDQSENAVRLVREHFPAVTVVLGGIDALADASSELARIWQRADLLVHGSGAGIYIRSTLDAWQATCRPWGAMGVTLSDPGKRRDHLASAAFLLTRETHSLDKLVADGVTQTNCALCPDGAFAFELRDDAAAERTLSRIGLNQSGFLVVVPRLRYTPYHKMPGRNERSQWPQAQVDHVEQTNARFAEIDHAKLRAAMVRWVRQTGQPVLLCPEMTYAQALLKPLLYDPLPALVKPAVYTWPGWWTPDIAASVYARAFCVVSIECHSPILAATGGTPFLHLRQPEDTVKGQMFRDLGFGEFVLEIDQITGDQLADRLMMFYSNSISVRQTMVAGMTAVDASYDQAAGIVAEVIGLRVKTAKV